MVHSCKGECGVGVAEGVVDVLDFGGGGVVDAAAEGFQVAAGGVGLGGLLVGGDPLSAIGEAVGINRPDARARAEMLADADAPGLGADAGAKAMLAKAHLGVDWVGSDAAEKIGYDRVGGVEDIVDGEDAEAVGSLVQP